MTLVWYTLLALAGAVVSYFWLKAQSFRREETANGCAPAPRLPQKDRVFGLDLFVQAGKMFSEHTFLPTFHERYRKMGATFEAKILGSRTIYSYDPANLQAVFATKAAKWGVSYRYPALGPYCGRAFLTVDGKEWEHSRTLLGPSFRKENMSNINDYEHYLSLMMSKIPQDGSTVDFQDLIFRLYLDTATLFLFGESFESLSGEQSKEALNFIDAAGYSLGGGGLRMALGPLMFLHRDKKWHESNDLIHSLVDGFIKRAMQRRETAKKSGVSLGGGRHIVLDSVLDQTTDLDFVRDEITQAFIALHETTACLISNIFWLLARHKDVFERLRNEVTAVSAEALAFDTTSSLPFMRCVINESLRYYPVFPYHIRIALEDTTLPTGGGVKGDQPIWIKKDTQFDGNFAVLHRAKEIWGPDADEFRPSRWETFKPKRWEFAPFGGGQRSCIGQQKAFNEVSYFVARVLREYDAIEPRDEKPWVGHVQITAKNLNGCKIMLHRAK